MELNLNDRIEYRPERPASQLLYDSDAVRLALFCLEPGQVIPPHTSTSEVIMMAAEGRGSFTVGEKQVPYSRGQVVTCAREEPHGAEAEERSVILAVIAPRPS